MDPENAGGKSDTPKKKPGRVKFEVERFRTFFLAGEQKTLIIYFLIRVVHLGGVWVLLWSSREVMNMLFPGDECVAGCMRGSGLSCCFWSVGTVVRNIVFLFVIVSFLATLSFLIVTEWNL